MRRGLVALLVFLAAARIAGQTQAQAQIQAPAPAETPSDTSEVLDRLGSLVRDGHLDVEADLLTGSVPAIPKYVLEVQGTPKTSITVQASEGKVTQMHFAVENGMLVVRGKGLRPKVAIESLDFQAPAGITGMKFHGLGIWKPIVAIFGGIARSAVRKMEFRTDIPSVLKGEILGGKKAPAPAVPAAPAPAAASVPPPTPTPSFMDLVREVRIHSIVATAFEGRPMALRPFVAFETAEHPQSGEAMKVTVRKGIFRPGHGGAGNAGNYVEFAGTLDGEIQNGTMEFEKNSCTIARGAIRGGEFQASTSDEGKLSTTLTAKQLVFELSSGDFVVPGGLGVALDSGSSFEVANLKVTSSGRFSGVAKLDLAGKTGKLSRKGATISASGIRLKTPGLTIVDGKATGPLELSFDYQLAYPFVVKYPIQEIPVKKMTLDFHGPFATTLQLEDAGGDEGEVTGHYVFKAPWAPIEQAALAALEAKWQQDVAIKHVDFAIEPKMFRPCGETCFTLGLEFTAQKKSGKKSLFSQFCAPVGKAELYVDKPARAFVLKNVRIETHCKGIVGWVVNFVAPLLAKTYGDLMLFQMPPGLPLTVDSVRGGADWVEIGGSIDWAASQGAPEAPALKPVPVVVQPEPSKS